MSDIKERIKGHMAGKPAKIPWPHRVLHDAVCRIDELEAENKKLREALEFVADWCNDSKDDDTFYGFQETEDMCRKALEGKDENN